MTLRGVGEFLESYVSSAEHERGQKYLKHDGRSGFPGTAWMTSYLKRKKLFLKEATKLSSARYNATKNPFVICHYFDILEEAIEKLKIKELDMVLIRLDLIWNCDESRLFHMSLKRVKSSPRKAKKPFKQNSLFFNYYYLRIVN